MQAHQIGFYIGTYTSGGGSKGIYFSTLNTVTGEISEPKLAGEALAPSYLAIHPNGHFLYAVHEFTAGDVSAYAIQPDHALKKLNTRTWAGAGPCHLSVDPSGRNVLAAAYSGGSFACFPIGEDGSLNEPSWTYANSGKPGRKPRGHMIESDARGTTVFACDLGTDEVLRFGFDAKRGHLVKRASTFLPDGSGPRHLAFGPKGQIFINAEMAMTITKVEAGGGPLASASTIPENVDRKGMSTAEIKVHPNGRWVYVSNRGHDSLAVFDTGTLRLVQIEPAGVKVPRGFDIDPTGNWLIAAGQNSGDLTSFAIDRKTGKLMPSNHQAQLPSPVCVTFLAK
jgi:6-phosphogluconolactonase